MKTGFYIIIVLLLVRCTLLADQDYGEWWSQASFVTEDRTVVTVKRKDPKSLPAISFVFRGKTYVVPENEIRSLPRLRYDSVSISYPPPARGDEHVTIHFALVFDPKSPDGETSVAFVFSRDGKFKHRYSYFRTKRVPIDR